MQKNLIVIVLVILGLYFLIAHVEPFPLNHEAIGLGTNHMVHRIFGVILLAGAVYVWKKNSNKAQPENK